MNTNARQVTNDVISAVEDGLLDWETVARAALNYLSEDDVEDMAEINDWNILIEDEEDEEEDDIEDEEEDEEKKSYVDSLSKETLDKIWEIADRYVTSSPVSGNWDTEILHERDAIVKELRLTKEEANEVMIEYLGFDALDIETAEKKFEKETTAQDANKNFYESVKEELTELEALSRFKKGEVLFINNNDGYTAIVPRNKLNDENAYISIDYDLGQKLIDRYDLKSLDSEGPDYNQEIYVYEDLNIEKSANSDRDGFKCVLCGKYSKGWGANKQYGNNPWPLSDEGDCCDNCNREKVIPARLAEMENKRLRENKKKKVTAQEVIDAAKKYGLTFTEEALKDLEWNVVDYINDSEFISADEWMKVIIDGETEDVSDLFVQNINWKKIFNESITEEVCPDCGKEVGKDGRCYNQECVAYDPISQYFDENFEIEFEDEEEDDGTLLNTDYDKLNFHDEGFLIGEMDLHYPEVSVLNMFDDDIFVEIDLSINVEPEFLLQYICDRNYIDREDLTVVEAQKFIDDIARTPDDYKDYLFDFYYEEAEIEAFKKADLEPNYVSDRRYTEMKENLDELESMLEQNDFEIDFYDGYLTGDVELYYDDLMIIGDEIPSGNPYEPSDWEEIVISYIYTADVSQSSLDDYVLDRFKLDADISNKELQKYIDKIESDPKEFSAYHDYLKEQFRERAEEQASYEGAGKEDDFDER